MLETTWSTLQRKTNMAYFLLKQEARGRLLALFHCMVRYGSARYGTVRLSSGQFAFPPQFSTAIEWAVLFTRRYNCAASTAVTSS